MAVALLGPLSACTTTADNMPGDSEPVRYFSKAEVKQKIIGRNLIFTSDGVLSGDRAKFNSNGTYEHQRQKNAVKYSIADSGKISCANNSYSFYEKGGSVFMKTKRNYSFKVSFAD